MGIWKTSFREFIDTHWQRLCPVVSRRSPYLDLTGNQETLPRVGDRVSQFLPSSDENGGSREWGVRERFHERSREWTTTTETDLMGRRRTSTATRSNGRSLVTDTPSGRVEMFHSGRTASRRSPGKNETGETVVRRGPSLWTETPIILIEKGRK